jgi:peptidyl-prolyl cis-trans isomerase C
VTDKNCVRVYVLACSLSVVLFSACASAPKQESALAYVDGDPVTISDIKYSIEVAHRRENLTGARKLDIPGYVQKEIDDRLFVQEARRMGMDEYPEVEQKVKAYVLRESVVRLYNEEVLEKVTVTDQEVNDYYLKNYDRFSLDIIELHSREDAETIMTALHNGANFGELSRDHPASFPKGGLDEYVYTALTMPLSVYNAVSPLEPGEFSNVVEVNNNYYIMKLIKREAPPADKLNEVRKGIEGRIRNEKIKEVSDAYLSQLHKEANIIIDGELLSSIQFGKGTGEKETWMKDERPLIKVNGEVLTAGRFAAMLSRSDRTTKDTTLKRWLDRKLVDQEALKRRYEEKTDLGDKVKAYRNRLVGKVFSDTMIASKIVVTDSEVRDYYLSHQDLYRMPVRYKIQQISLQSREEADDVSKSLLNGASFSWLAKEKSKDSYASRGGVMGWKMKDGLDRTLADVIDTFNPGDVSPVLYADGHYRIVRLMERTESKPEEFDKVKDLAYQAVYREKYMELYTGYLEKLRKKAVILVNNEAVRSLEQRFQN